MSAAASGAAQNRQPRGDSHRIAVNEWSFAKKFFEYSRLPSYQRPPGQELNRMDDASGPGRNIEIKARIADRDAVEGRAAALADRGPIRIAQRDTFYRCTDGRLKLRVFEDGSGELIQYRRPDTLAPSESSYTIYPTREPEILHAALANALGVRGVVRKVRTLYLAGVTRIHLDRVEGLGEFAELEVVLAPGQDAAAGYETAAGLVTALGIAEGDLLEPAYIDLIELDRLGGRSGRSE